MGIINKEVKFWANENGKPTILHAKLIEFLEAEGFIRVATSDVNCILAKINNNRLRRVSENEIIETIKIHLLERDLKEVFEVFAKSVGSYISSRKLALLKSVELINDRDGKFDSNFFFKNCYCNINEYVITVQDYKNLPFVIWDKRIQALDFNTPADENPGQFEQFCFNISKKSPERFQALKTTLGYLLHRNKDRGEFKAVILYDEYMGLNGQAHGGTGKTLLSEALKKCREVAIYDAKAIKVGSWFINQRVELTTDTIVYDDLKKDFSFEQFFPIITSGIEVEKKHQQAFYIDSDKTPKLLISSNYLVKGPGGPSDERRRYEFEIANYYNIENTPEIEFGNKFFDAYWPEEEWNKFYQFMMSCVQEYLRFGLITAEPLNLNRLKLEDNNCPEFIEFAEQYLEINKWLDKREIFAIFKEFYPGFEDLSSHRFTKMTKDYLMKMGYEYEDKSTGGGYLFIIKNEAA
nr:hypothetical protein [uncultured Flavobacterium sp.]